MEVRFRGGFIIKQGRDIDKDTLEPLAKWDQKPKRISDHTWCEVTYHPSLRSYVVDPSSFKINIPIDMSYSRFGGMHVSDKLQCGSMQPKPPKFCFQDGVVVKQKKRQILERNQKIKTINNLPIDWKNLFSAKIDQ